jgi:glycosyltransferase involved in cell wall biosynthesis
LKVLFISSGKNGPGISPFIRAQGESLKKMDVDLDFFTIERHGLLGYLRSALRLRKHLGSNAADILHAHYGLSAWVGLIARRKEKLVVSFMGDDILGTNRTDGSVTRVSLLLARINVFLARKYYDHAIVKSEAMRTRLNTDCLALIPNGVDLRRFKPSTKLEARNNIGIAPEAKLVIFASDPSREEKNHRLALRAVEFLKNPEVILVPVFQRTPESMPEYYNAADALVLTSFHEGSPNVIKEAMACNCPIVATDVGDVAWLISGVEGCYLTSFDPQDVAEKLSQALDFAEKKGRTKGKERLTELGLDSESVARRIIAVYQKVLG